jgi:hypothetical protein
MNIIKHWRTDTLISMTLRIDLAWSQWRAGTAQPILEDITIPLLYLECRYLSSTRLFLRDLGGQIRVDETFTQSKERANDIFIMDFAISSGLFTAADLAILNYCRLHLHVTTISELFDASGTCIIPHMFKCYRRPWFDPTTVITLQRRPSDYQVKYQWQRLLRQWSDEHRNIAQSMDLGPWCVQSHQHRLRRRTYFEDGPWPILYHWHIDCYWEGHPTQYDPCVYVLIRDTSWRPTPSCVPIDVTHHANDTLHLDIDPSDDHLPAPQALPFIHYEFSDYVQTLPAWEREILEHIDSRRDFSTS